MDVGAPGKQLAASELLVVGRIAGAYGVKGWFRLQSFTELADNLLNYEHFYMERNGAYQPVVFEDIKQHGDGLVGKLPGVDDREGARRLANTLLAVPLAELPPLPEEEFYWHQLQGLQVWAEFAGAEPRLLGKVDHLLETGANDVLVVQPCEGSIDQRERLIPYRPGAVVLAVDLAAGSLRVDWDPDF